jgi:hypothetical protein
MENAWADGWAERGSRCDKASDRPAGRRVATALLPTPEFRGGLPVGMVGALRRYTTRYCSIPIEDLLRLVRACGWCHIKLGVVIANHIWC